MKEKIKTLMKNNIYNITVISTILAAYLTYIIMKSESILLFFIITPFFLAIIWFFSRDKQIKEFKTAFNEKFILLGKAIAIIFRIFVFLIFLFSIFIVVAGIVVSIGEIKRGAEILLTREEGETSFPKFETFPEEKLVQLNNKSIKKEEILWKRSNLINKGEKLDSNHTEGKFIEIWVEVENLSSITKSVKIISDKIKLIDDKKREFPLFKGEKMEAEQGYQMFKSLFWQGLALKPGIPIGFKLFFEVAENSNNYLINLYYE